MELPQPRWRWALVGGAETDDAAHAVPVASPGAVPPAGGPVLPGPPAGSGPAPEATAACGVRAAEWGAVPASPRRHRCGDCWAAVFDPALASLGPEGVVLAYHHAGCSPTEALAGGALARS